MQQTNDALQELNNTRVLTEADQRRKKTLTENLPKQYLATLNRFQEAQRTGARKEKESLQRARGVTYQQVGTHNQGFEDDPFSSQTQYQQQQVVLPIEQDVDMQALKERDDQLRQLETNIVQVNELFKDVHRLVNEHGEIIVTIGDSITEVDKNVGSANVQLKQAVTYQSAARRKKICLIVILLVVLAIVALILGLYFGLGKK